MLRSSSRLKSIGSLKNGLVFPERFKGTFLERWANYWKSLYADYRGMVVDIRTDMQEKPVKALAMLTGIACAVQMARHNPDEVDFREDLRRYTNQLILVSESCQNPKTVDFFKHLEDSANRGVLRNTNLGLCSVMWIDDHSKDCDLYKTKCDYIQPKYSSMPFRIVDVGIIGRWWNMYIKYQDFDIHS